MDKRYPLGLPPGSVRALAFLALLGAGIAEIGSPDVGKLLLVAGGFYFGARTAEKRDGGNE